MQRLWWTAGVVAVACRPVADKGGPSMSDLGHTGSEAPPVDTTDSGDSSEPAVDVDVPEPNIDATLATPEASSRRCENPEERELEGPGRWVEDPDSLGALPDVDLDTLPGATMSIALGDLDNDGILDMAVGHPTGVRLFIGDGDASFSPAPYAWPTAPEAGALISGVLLVDLDDDGDLDVLVTHRTRPPLRYTNLGDGHFEVHDDLGPAAGRTAHMGPAVADIDGDGELELVVGGNQARRFISHDETPPLPGALYELAGGRLAESTVELPERAHDGYTFVTTLLDFDDDGHLDAYFANDHGSAAPGNAVLWGGADSPSGFAADDRHSGLEVAMASMGTGVGDIDEDGLPDLVISNWGAPAMLLSGGGAWYDAALSRGVVDTPSASVGWGTDVADIDNDGDLDIYMVFGHIPGADDPARENARRQPDKLFLNDGTGHFEDVAPHWLLDRWDLGRVAMLADLDNDGFLDAVLANQIKPPRVWRARCDGSAWLTVHLEQPAPNSGAIGARVQVVVDGRVHTRWLTAGGQSFGAGHPHRLHFGLGEHDRVDRIVVTWPDGSVSEHTDIATRRAVHIERE